MKKYMCFDTGEIWEETEIKKEYDALKDFMETRQTFEEYMSWQLSLGYQKIGGLVEIEN